MDKKKKGLLTGIFVFLIGIICLVTASYTRTLQEEFVQFPILLTIYLISGWLLNRFFRKLSPYPLIFISPTIAILIVAFIINSNGRIHYFGETIMIVPGFLIGYYFFRWERKIQFTAAVLLPLFYFLYLYKINPNLIYLNGSKSVRKTASSKIDTIQNFQFITPEGRFVSFDDYRGKVVLLDLYFNNCAPCRLKMTALAKIQEHYAKEKGFILLGVHIGTTEDYESFKTTIRQFPKNIEFVYDSTNQRIANQYSLNSFPQELLFDKKGRLRQQLEGYNKDIDLVYKQITIKKVDALLNEKN